jgi:peptidoglycan/xylan/chitin deacetylase (PgdA/CDA1 family)
MTKLIIKHFLSILLFYSKLLGLYVILKRYFFPSRSTILMYHRVLDFDLEIETDNSHQGMVVSARTFEKQVAYLKQSYCVISLNDYIHENSHPLNSCIITFDDGWRDNYVNALPILKHYHCPATIYISTDYVGTSNVFWQEGLVRDIFNLKRNKKLNNFIVQNESAFNLTEQLREIDKAGPHECQIIKDQFIELLMSMDEQLVTRICKTVREYYEQDYDSSEDRRWILNWDEIKDMLNHDISFGSHCKSHRRLTGMDVEEAKGELRESKKMIEEHLKIPIETMAYPNGDYNDRISVLTGEAGYVCALSTTPGQYDKNGNLVIMGRTGIHEAMCTGIGGGFSKALFACVVSGIYDDIGRLLGKVNLFKAAKAVQSP